MKPILLCLAALLAARITAQPASVADSLFVEEFRQGVSFTNSMIWLKSDGTFQTLSVDPRSTSTGIAAALAGGVSGQGVYTYARTPTAQSATLVLGSVLRTLNFVSATTGSIASNTAASGNFELLPRRNDNPRANVALRARVQRDAGLVIAGIVLTQQQWVLLRVVGPGLARFGVINFASAPNLALYSGAQLQFTLSGWENTTGSSFPQTTFQLVGAFPLEAGSSDAAILRRLPAGNHTVQVGMQAGSTEGELLIEIYYLPFSA